MVLVLARIAVALAAFALGSAAVRAAPEPTDADFLAAKAAFEHGQRSRLEALAARLSGHGLESYVEYWRLASRLDVLTVDDARGFVTKWADSPLAERLRVDALKAFGKRGDWYAFGALYPPAAGEDVELSCYAIQFRRQRDGNAPLAAVKPLWFNGQTTPEACEPLFAALIGSGELTITDRRARFRLAAETGNVRLAREIADAMPGDSRIAARDLAAADRDAGRALAKGEFAWGTQGGRDLALYALERAARNDAGAARAAWEKQRVRLPPADRLYGNARLAYHAARQLHPLANDWYREAEGAAYNDSQHAWRARAALRAGAWSDVEAAIAAMPPALAQEPGWRYWKARALGAAGRGDDARTLYAGLAAEFGFYAFLGAEALGQRIEPLSQPANPSPELLGAFGAQPGIRRAVKLAELDMRLESQREWAYVVRGRDDEGLLVAAAYAQSVGLYDRAINTAERTTARHDFRLRYLMPYREHFVAAARDQAADPALLFSLARQESRFAPDIVSSAGAVGLMQLMPPTARWVAKQMGRTDYQSAQIADLATNTQFGAFYFKHCQDRLEGMPALAAAAYNAGPNRAQAWRGGAPLEGAIWVESIPFNETRDYVKKVLANAMFYARELEQPYVPLSTRLGTVPPRGNGSVSGADGAGTIASKAP